MIKDKQRVMIDSAIKDLSLNLNYPLTVIQKALTTLLPLSNEIVWYLQLEPPPLYSSGEGVYTWSFSFQIIFLLSNFVFLEKSGIWYC